MEQKQIKRQERITVLLNALIVLILILIPTGYEDAVIKDNAERIPARVISVDNEHIIDTGLVRAGEQDCQVELLVGNFRGEVHTAVNMLAGSLEQDKIFQPGDLALVMVSQTDSRVIGVSTIDHFRIHWEILLLIIFFGILILFAGWMGVRAILAFTMTILMLWKVLVPMYLNGINPIISGLLLTGFLIVMVISLVYGFSRRWLAAVSGTMIGLIVTCVLGIVATRGLKIHGAVMAFSESLLYSGYQRLNLTEIFMASIFIGSSGAMLDLAVDITSAVYEVTEKRPDLNWREAMKSGAQVGRAALSTMTTTLLLAYSGGFISLLMVFMAQGTPIINILNLKYVAAEMVHTMVGSFGLVTVAPFTAFTAGVLLAKNDKSWVMATTEEAVEAEGID